MNKELEEFKKEMVTTLKDIMVCVEEGQGLYKINCCIKDLEPKPEFIEGEIVLASDDGKDWIITKFDRLGKNTFICDEQEWILCKKLEALPMHMTDHDGSRSYPVNVLKGTLVFVRLNTGKYPGGKASEFEWNKVAKYQILKDLKEAE